MLRFKDVLRDILSLLSLGANRTTSETVSPNQPEYKASRHYDYYLVGSDGQQAWQTSTDVKGVSTRSLIDGLNRMTTELRHDADAEDSRKHNGFRMRYEARYDALGQLLEETDYDWLGGEVLPLRTQYLYDNWGQRRCVIGPDEVQHHELTDPIGTAESGNLPIHTSWSQSEDGELRRKPNGREPASSPTVENCAALTLPILIRLAGWPLSIMSIRQVPESTLP